jgi:hypothetical protein
MTIFEDNIILAPHICKHAQHSARSITVTVIFKRAPLEPHKCVRFTVDAMEVLIKYCMNSFPQVDQFIRIQISFYFLCVSYWSIGSETKSNWHI